MILACRQLHKAYGIDVILEKITFHIEEREKAAIVGVNGAGKTTLFKVLTGEISADGGEFYLKKDASLGYLAQNIQIARFMKKCYRFLKKSFKQRQIFVN